MSSPYRRIACCIDRDGMEDILVEEALALAAGGTGVVHVVHVLAPVRAIATGPYAYVHPPAESREEVEAWLDEVAARHPGVASTRILDGDPVRAVCDWAVRWGADLLVAAARRRLFERVVVGGFASRIAYRAPCAVLLIHGGATVAGDAAAVAR